MKIGDALKISKFIRREHWFPDEYVLYLEPEDKSDDSEDYGKWVWGEVRDCVFPFLPENLTADDWEPYYEEVEVSFDDAVDFLEKGHKARPESFDEGCYIIKSKHFGYLVDNLGQGYVPKINHFKETWIVLKGGSR